MSEPRGGGSAFPVSAGMGPLSANFVSPGMSKREWMATQIMIGVLAGRKIQDPPDWVVRTSLELTDLLLRKLEDIWPVNPHNEA